MPKIQIILWQQSVARWCIFEYEWTNWTVRMEAQYGLCFIFDVSITIVFWCKRCIAVAFHAKSHTKSSYGFKLLRKAHSEQTSHSVCEGMRTDEEREIERENEFSVWFWLFFFSNISIVYVLVWCMHENLCCLNYWSKRQKRFSVCAMYAHKIHAFFSKANMENLQAMASLFV